MTGNSIGNGAPPQQNAPQSTGNAAPNQAARLDAGSLKFINKKAREASLNRSLGAWAGRADDSKARMAFARLAKWSTSIRRNQGAIVGSHGIYEEFDPEELKEHLTEEADRAVRALGERLFADLGNTNKVARSLHSKYQNAIATLQQYSQGSANLTDAQAHMRGFTNLKLFAAFGGDLHSTRGGKNKLTRTIAKIPKKVLMNASEDVTFKDYGKADHLKFEGAKRRLLSFHIGFKTTRSWLGKDKHSRAYRENLRAITASALLLGGFKAAVQIKEVLSKINSLRRFADSKSREDIVANALARLAEHGDVNALMDDLVFEVERHLLLESHASLYDHLLATNDEKEFYKTVRSKLKILEKLSERRQIIQNLGKKIQGKERGYYPNGPRRPYNLLRDLKGVTDENPIEYFLKLLPNDAQSAQTAIDIWVGLMTREGSTERDKIYREITKIDNEKGTRNREAIYFNAARSFADIDKRNFSIAEQCVLLHSCLRQPFAEASTHRKKLERWKAINQKNKLDIINESAPKPLQDSSNVDTDDKKDIKQDLDSNSNINKNSEIKDDVKYDRDDIGKIAGFSGQRLASFLKQRTRPISEEPDNLETDTEFEEAPQRSKGPSGGEDQWKGLVATDLEDVKTDISDDDFDVSDKGDDPGYSSEIPSDPAETDGLPSDPSGKKDV